MSNLETIVQAGVIAGAVFIGYIMGRMRCFDVYLDDHDSIRKQLSRARDDLSVANDRIKEMKEHANEIAEL